MPEKSKKGPKNLCISVYFLAILVIFDCVWICVLCWACKAILCIQIGISTQHANTGEFPHSISSFLESVECVEIRRAASEYECRVFVFRLMIEWVRVASLWNLVNKCWVRVNIEWKLEWTRVFFNLFIFKSRPKKIIFSKSLRKISRKAIWTTKLWTFRF